MKHNTIVSLADANYFDLLNELVDSIKSFKESENIAICVLDAGLTENQKNLLKNKVDEIKKAYYDLMKKFHPDKDGNNYLSNLISEAKNKLLNQ